MSLRFCSLGSGSSGNATLVEVRRGAHVQRLLVDCGLSLRELNRRLALRGCSANDIDAVFVTHEHGDHVGCAMILARRHGTPVWMSEGTWHGVAREQPAPSTLRIARDAESIDLGLLELRPYTVPHDAREPLQLSISDGHQRLGVLTDVGLATERIVQELQACNALLLECNHDQQMLDDGPYPLSLKRRIAGPYGHLANHVAADILARCRHAALRHVVAAHLSEQNNRPDLAAQALAEALGTHSGDIVVAGPLHGCDWLDLH
jgi:phosphoribosyl 1,2-cyclic phosphodiesterase